MSTSCCPIIISCLVKRGVPEVDVETTSASCFLFCVGGAHIDSLDRSFPNELGSSASLFHGHECPQGAYLVSKLGHESMPLSLFQG